MGIPVWRLRQAATATPPGRVNETRANRVAQSKASHRDARAGVESRAETCAQSTAVAAGIAIYSAQPDPQLMRQFKVIAERPWRVAVPTSITAAQRTLLDSILACCARRIAQPSADTGSGAMLCFGVANPKSVDHALHLPALADILDQPAALKPGVWKQLAGWLRQSR